MGLVSLLQKQVETRAQMICQQRNQSLPTELGKAGFESLDNGVVFIQQHFLLDSSHCDYTYPIAKVVWNSELGLWQLFVPNDEESDESNDYWSPYPYLTPSSDLASVMKEVAQDPNAVFWYNKKA